MKTTKKYWMGPNKFENQPDDFGDKITTIFIDGKTDLGPWGFMTPKSFKAHGIGLGLGRGQKYELQPNNRWLKIEG